MIIWKTIEKDGPPKDRSGFNSPFINCIVYACHPESTQGGVVEVCRWNVEKGEWHRSDIQKNWFLSDPYKITHYCDEYNNPVTG